LPILIHFAIFLVPEEFYMPKYIGLIFIFLFFFHGGIVFAESYIKLVTFQSDAFPGIGSLVLVQNSTGLCKQLIFNDLDGQVLKYTLDELQNAPQVLEKSGNNDITFLALEQDFNPLSGGHGLVKFLVSGISKTYKSFRFLLSINGDHVSLKSEPSLSSPDSDGNSFKGSFNHLFLKKNSLLGLTIGVSEIIPRMK
jgi:hypothetical protein